MEHVNGWCFRGIYKGGLWEDDLHVSALYLRTGELKTNRARAFILAYDTYFDKLSSTVKFH